MTMYSSTAKYIRLAIEHFLPELEARKKAASGTIAEQLQNLIDMYQDIANEIDHHGLGFADPNRRENGEPYEIEMQLTEEVVSNLTGLVARLLEEWKRELARLENKGYTTQDNKIKIVQLKEFIWPLEAHFEGNQHLFNKHRNEGPAVFPGEGAQPEHRPEVRPSTKLIPSELIAAIPEEMGVLCSEFNFNYEHGNPNACILLLRKLLPLLLVRKFQRLNREAEIRDTKNELLDTQGLMGKAEGLMSSPRVYRSVMDYKLLIDSSQHIYTVRISIDEVPGPATAIRILLEDLFSP
jgi:hypothetical protein